MCTSHGHTKNITIICTVSIGPPVALKKSYIKAAEKIVSKQRQRPSPQVPQQPTPAQPRPSGRPPSSESRPVPPLTSATCGPNRRTSKHHFPPVSTAARVFMQFALRRKYPGLMVPAAAARLGSVTEKSHATRPVRQTSNFGIPNCCFHPVWVNSVPLQQILLQRKTDRRHRRRRVIDHESRQGVSPFIMYDLQAAQLAASTPYDV